MITLQRLAAVLGSARLDLSNEAACQADIVTLLEGVLPAAAISREHRLSPADRPDFLISGQWVIEVKVKGAPRNAIERQLARYARWPQVRGLVLATGTAVSLPAMLEGKPLSVVSLGRAWL